MRGGLPEFQGGSAVTGSTFAVPRTPSVPKIFLGRSLLKSGGGHHPGLARVIK